MKMVKRFLVKESSLRRRAFNEVGLRIPALAAADPWNQSGSKGPRYLLQAQDEDWTVLFVDHDAAAGDSHWICGINVI